MMKTILLLGLLLTMGGVGGIENSTDNFSLFWSIAISALGVALMYVATFLIGKENE